MYNNSNPSELYPKTTWELISSDKYIKTTSSSPLVTGGNNSLTIAKTNLPNVSLKITSFALTTQAHTHKTVKSGTANSWNAGQTWAQNWYGSCHESYFGKTFAQTADSCPSGSGGGQNTGTASPSTEALGSGSPISIQPEYITLRFWKRLS